MRPSLDTFLTELASINSHKTAGLRDVASGVGKWLRNQHSQLGLAAGEAIQSNIPTYSPVLGQNTVPIMGTVKNFIANKFQKPSKPPGPIVEKIQKVWASKPVQSSLPALDQASEMLRFVKLAKVSPYQQKTQYSCSAACLKAVLEHWGHDRLSEAEVMHAIGVRDRGGAEVDQITEGAKVLGFDAYDKCFESLDDARSVTDQDIPIVADFQSFNNPGKGHYVVITKIDDENVYLMDPNTDGNERVLTREEAEGRWWDRTMAPPHRLMPRWGVVVTPKRHTGTKVDGP